MPVRQFSWFIILVLSLAISLGLFSTIHLEVQLQDLPTYYGLNQDTNVVGHGSLPVVGYVSMCLKVLAKQTLS